MLVASEKSSREDIVMDLGYLPILILIIDQQGAHFDWATSVTCVSGQLFILTLISFA